MPDSPIVAVLGTGTMGAGMARSLHREGLTVRAWNRSADKAEPLAAEGIEVCTDAVTAVTGADVVITMLFDADSVLEVAADVAAALHADAIWVQSATIGLDGIARVEEFARSRSLTLLDAPVLGTKGPAEQGKLVVLASGDPALRDRLAPVLDAIGSRTVWAGDQVGKASALKLACNAWVASITAATAQSVALAGALDLDPALFLDAIKGGPTDTPYAQLKGGQMIQGSFDPAFALDGVRKDIGLITDAAAGAGVDTTVLAALGAVYAEASSRGHGADDMAAVVTAFTD